VLHLHNVASFVPDESIAVTDLRVPLGLSHRETRLFSRFMGMDRVTTAGRLTVLDMLLAAGEEALRGADRSQVRYLIHAHTVQLVAPPGLRLVDALREKLGLSEARSFTMSHQTCVTGLYSLLTAETLLRAEPPHSTALVVIGEKVVSSVMQHLPETTIFGDAAAAGLLGLDGPGDAVLAVAHRTLGEFYESQNMPPDLQGRYRQIYVPTLVSVMQEAVRQAGLEMADISLVLPHNVNRYSWSTAARLLGVPLSRIYLENVPRTGHCFCSDPFVNLSTARAEGAVKPGGIVLMTSAGQGGTFCAAVVRITEEG
jgi:3-oxoacyl-[acyl-carrier-protein] synthase III